MNFSVFIAKRYFFSKKKKSFISMISNISMLGVGVGVMALVIVLSVFNGLEDFQRNLYKSFDADLKVSPLKGKKFALNENTVKRLKHCDNVQIVNKVIQENALLKYNGAQMVVNIKGVENDFIKQSRLKKSILKGDLILKESGQDFVVLGSGVYVTLGANLEDFMNPIQVMYPKNTQAKTLDFSSEDAFSNLNVFPSGVFAIEQEFDNNYAFVGFDAANELFNFGNNISYFEITVKDKAKIEETQAKIIDILGKDFLVKNQDQQHESLFKAIKIEKLFVFLALSFIIGIASFNIFFSLSMLLLEKKEDIKILKALGASSGMIKWIFISESAIIAFSGAIVGLILGFTICLVQQLYGIVPMGISNALIDAYPVKMIPSDFVSIALLVIFLTLLVSYFPAKKAAALN